MTCDRCMASELDEVLSIRACQTLAGVPSIAPFSFSKLGQLKLRFIFTFMLKSIFPVTSQGLIHTGPPRTPGLLGTVVYSARCQQQRLLGNLLPAPAQGVCCLLAVACLSVHLAGCPGTLLPQTRRTRLVGHPQKKSRLAHGRLLGPIGI